MRYRYDGFGRVREVIPDDGIASETSYLEDPVEPWGLIIAGTSADGGESVTRVDEWGRTLWASHRGFDGNWVHHRADYNLFGQRTKAWRPSVGQAPSLVTETTFDTLGRAVSVIEPNGATTTMTHTMFETLTTDPAGRQSRITRDVDNRVTQTANFYQGNWVGMTYLYGAFNQVEDVVDPANNVIHAMYDKLGRRFLLDDPDRGTTMWSFNGFGEVTSEMDALGDTTSYDRDLLGRVTWTSHDVNGVTTFSYDGQNNPGERGRLTYSSSPDDVAVAYGYDPLGRSSDTTWQVGQDTYSLHREYDPLGRLAEVRYPEVPGHDPFVAKYGYNLRGYASSVVDGTDPASPALLWQVDARNADGLVTEDQTGNLFTETRQYEAATGQLTNVEAVKSGEALFAVHYERDLTGNIVARSDYAQVNPRMEQFQYDELDRLQVWSLLNNHEQVTTEYGYDLLGNIETVTASGVVETHAHAGQLLNGVQRLPHALTSRTKGAQTSSYLYDARGRQLLGDGREITWKPFDLPSTIHQDGHTTTLSYDAFGTRVRKVREAGGVFVDGVDTIGGLYERRWNADGKVEHVLTVNGTDGPVAQIVYTEDPNDPARKLFLHQEALGSVGLVTDSIGGEVQRTYFDPFGAKIGADGAAMSPEMGDVKLGFTGHRHDDELGLIDMHGRVYDPAQKRFLSPDPHVTDPLFGQNYNRYSYVLNNPLRFTDPTGFDDELTPGAVEHTGGDEDNAPPASADSAAPEIAPSPAMTPSSTPGVQMSDDSGHNESVDNGLESTMTITVEDGTDEGRDHDRGMALMLARPTSVRLPGDNGVLFKAHGSRRDPKPIDESLARDLASDAGEMIVRTWLCLEAGEVGCLAGKALYSGGTDVIEGAATGNSDEIRDGVKKILTAVQAQVATELVGKALEEIDAVNTRMVTNSAGTPVPQTVVNNQDELLAEAEKAAGGSLDDFTERKPGRWISKDGLKQIEWSPEGHANTNEGPHVTVQERSGTRERWRVTKKAFIDGRRNY